MGGGAWPFLVGGVICLVDSVNERDLNLLTSRAVSERRGSRSGRAFRRRQGWSPLLVWRLLRGTLGVYLSRGKIEAITGL